MMLMVLPHVQVPCNPLGCTLCLVCCAAPTSHRAVGNPSETHPRPKPSGALPAGALYPLEMHIVSRVPLSPPIPGCTGAMDCLVVVGIMIQV